MEYIVIVYSGFCHWDKPIDELEQIFSTEGQAREYINILSKYRPEYRTEIIIGG